MDTALQIISQKLEDYISATELVHTHEPLWLQYFTKRLTVKDGNILRMIPLSSILYLQSKSNYTLIVTGNKQFLICKTLKHFESSLVHPYFSRVHNSFIINKMYVDSISKSDQKIKMKNGALIPISKSFKYLNQILL